MNAEIIFQERVEVSDYLTDREIQNLILNKNLKVLQFSEPVEVDTLKLLNDQFFPKRPEVQLRIYGFYGQVADLSITSFLTNVVHFSADCLMHARGFEYLAEMKKLESLGVGVYHLEDFSFLDRIPNHLKKLFLGATKSKKPDLEPLSRFSLLEEIYLEGQQKNIEVLAQLRTLRDVTLRSISTPDIAYLHPLDQMWSLDIKLGGIKNLNDIRGMKNIKYLELWQISGLSDIGVISSLTGLQYLFLQSLRRVEYLPDLVNLRKLRRIYLENLKGLKDLRTLQFAPALEEFIHTSAGNLQPEDYMPLLVNPSLREAGVWFGSERRNYRFMELLKAYNKKPFEYHPFEFI